MTAHIINFFTIIYHNVELTKILNLTFFSLFFQTIK